MRDSKVTRELYLNGSSRQQHHGVGFILQSLDSRDFAYALKYEFTPSNNESEYKALIVGIQITLALNLEQLIILGDSNVVFEQVTGSFESKEPHTKRYAALVEGLLKDFKITWSEKINRKKNQ